MNTRPLDTLDIIGVDIAKHKFDAALDGKQVLTLSNSPEGFDKLLAALEDCQSACVVMEATGGYEQALAGFLLAQGIAVAVLNAKLVRDFAKSIGRYAKNDRIDAQVIRQYGRFAAAQGCLGLCGARSEAAQRIEALLKRRDQLVGQRAIEKQHLENVVDPDAIGSIKRAIEWLDEETGAIGNKIKNHLKALDDKELNNKINRLTEVKGIGELTALLLVFWLPELGQLSNKEIAALAGLAPFSRDSGKKSGRRAIFGGRARVRSALYMAVLSATRYNTPIKTFYKRLLAGGKCKKLALTACMRKLLVILNAITKKQCQWNPEHLKTV